MTDSATEVGIRAAAVGDAAGMARVQVESWRATYAGMLPSAFLAGLDAAENAASWRRLLAAPDRRAAVRVAADRDRGIVGFASAGPSRRPALPYRSEVYAIYLDGDFHGRGVGRRLFLSAAAAAAGTGDPSLIVWCLRGNPSRYFYERLGGVLVARRPRRFGGAELEEAGYGWAGGAGAPER